MSDFLQQTSTMEVSVAPVTTEPAPPADPQVNAFDAELDRAKQAAIGFLEDQEKKGAEPKPDDRPRGPDGKFMSADPEKAVEPEPEIQLDPAWVYAAEQEGFSADDIKAFKSDRELQEKVEERRTSALRRLGIGVEEFREFQQFKQSRTNGHAKPEAAEQPPPVQAPVASAPEYKPVKVELNEEEMAPEHVKAFRSMEQQFNEAQSALLKVVNQRDEKFARLESEVRQSAEQRKAAQDAERQASMWDSAAAEIPGFTEAFGGLTPSKLQALSNVRPGDPRVVAFEAWGKYMAPRYQEEVRANGENEASFRRAMKTSFAASPFASRAKGNGVVNNESKIPAPGQLAEGSLIHGPNQRSNGMSPQSTSDPMDAEREIIERNVSKFLASQRA